MLSALSGAWASWKATPGVALLAVLAFAIGIGAATAIFTVVNGALLRPLPYPESERFVTLYGTRTTEPGTRFFSSVPDLQDYAEQATSFDAFGWFRSGRFNLTAPGEPQFIPGVEVTPALARELGPPLLGQWLPTTRAWSSRARSGGAWAAGPTSSAAGSRSAIAATPSAASCRRCSGCRS